jgi:hypothetical protein
MRTICQISGIPIWKSPLLMGMDLADEHPIFRLKKSLLYTKEMIHRFAFAENTDEKKLIYLAFLKSTHLVEFKHPADPSLATMEATFYRLQNTAQWLSYAEYHLARQASFPQYIVTFDTRHLENVRSWLDAVDDIKTKIYRNDLLRDKNAMLLNHEMEIKKELGDANIFNRAFTPKLARWALEVCDITIKHKNYAKYMKLLCTPLQEAFIYKMEEFLEVQEILQLGLPNVEENPQAISVMHQMSQLIRECRRGFTEFSMIDDSDSAEVKDFEILVDVGDDNEHRRVKINQHLVDVPTEMPQLRDYPSKLAYLKAKAKWDISQSMKRKQIGDSNV